MNSFFPYRFVPRGSRIVLYGGGVVGKEYYLQIHETDWCEVIAWIDKSFEAYDVQSPFDYVRNITKYSPDYYVIAEKNIEKVNQIRAELIGEQGIDGKKIVWSRCYSDLGEGYFPGNRVQYLKDLEFYMNLLDDYLEADDFFATNKYYQSYAPLGIKGARDNGERLLLYNTASFLNKESDVLDIGCNSGFFALTLAPYVKRIYGVDISENFINIANKVKEYMGIENAYFHMKDVFKEGVKGRYDGIFMLSLPSDIGVYEKAGIIADSLKKGGYLFLESHYMDSNSEAYLYDKLVKTYREKGINKVCLHRNSFLDNRDITVLQKTE